MWRAAVRVVLLFAVIIGFSVALGAYMNYASVRRAYLDAIHSRMHLVASGIVQVAEKAQSLGITLAAQHTLPPLLVEQHQASPLLRSIDVFGPRHRVLFSSSAARVGRVLNESMLRSDPYREIEPIVNNLGITTGGLLLRVDRAAIRHQLHQLAAVIIDATLPALLVALVIGGGGGMLLLIRLRNQAASATELAVRNPPIRTALADISTVDKQLEQAASTIDGRAR